MDALTLISNKSMIIKKLNTIDSSLLLIKYLEKGIYLYVKQNIQKD